MFADRKRVLKLIDARSRYFALKGDKNKTAEKRAKEHLLKVTKTQSVREALSLIAAVSGGSHQSTRSVPEGMRVVELRASGPARKRLEGGPVKHVITNNVGRGRRSN